MASPILKGKFPGGFCKYFIIFHCLKSKWHVLKQSVSIFKPFQTGSHHPAIGAGSAFRVASVALARSAVAAQNSQMSRISEIQGLRSDGCCSSPWKIRANLVLTVSAHLELLSERYLGWEKDEMKWGTRQRSNVWPCWKDVMNSFFRFYSKVIVKLCKMDHGEKMWWIHFFDFIVKS